MPRAKRKTGLIVARKFYVLEVAKFVEGVKNWVESFA
jgi:hypothetical protein